MPVCRRYLVRLEGWKEVGAPKAGGFPLVHGGGGLTYSTIEDCPPEDSVRGVRRRLSQGVDAIAVVVEAVKGEQEAAQLDKPDHTTESTTWWKSLAGLGLFIIVLKNVLNGLNDVIVKSLPSLHPITVMFIRSLLMLSMLMPVSIVKDQGPFPPGQCLLDRGLLVLRCIIGAFKVGRLLF